MSTEALGIVQVPDEGTHAGGRVCTALEWLVDNARAYDALVRSITGARTSIWITQLALDVDCVMHATDSSRDDVPLLDILLEAESRGVDVRVLLNASLLLDTAKPLRAFLAARRSAIRVRGVSRFPQLLHAKIVIIDEKEAFLIGSPFVNGYWDDSRHRPADDRRPARELGGRPLHDVSVRVAGSAVASLGKVFAELWNDAAGGAADGDVVGYLPAPGGRAVDRDANHGILEVVRTAARKSLRADPDGRAEILGALLEAIGHARSSIYIEHQYLSARPVISALAAALRRVPALELIVVLNQNPDVTAYRQWQNARLRDAGLLRHPRVGVFALWTIGDSEPGAARAINQVFVHSKVVTIDDCWATVGSANLDGVSLHSYGDDFTSRVARRVFRHVRNFDVSIVVDERHNGELNDVRDLRERLWREHLGESIGTRDALDGSALAVWRGHACRNVAALNGVAADASVRAKNFIMPYSTCATPADQLGDVGVRIDSRRHDLLFNPGWLEVHASPNWVRNMFL